MADPEPRYDVVIYVLSTGKATGIGGHNLPLTSHSGECAVLCLHGLHQTLRPEMGADIVMAGTIQKGELVPDSDIRQARILQVENMPEIRSKRRRQEMQYRNPAERQAASVCIVCESPNLATRIHCERHAAEANKKTSSANRDRQ